MGKEILIKENTFEKARKKVQENLGKRIIFANDDDELNRKVLEKLKINILLLSQEKRRDFSKQRNSGLNHVLARIAKKNKIDVGIDLDEIIEAEGKLKAEILARVSQNAKLCNKNKIQMRFISQKQKRDQHDLKALGLVIGMPTWMTKHF